MNRWLILLLGAALLVFTSCGKDVVLSVDAELSCHCTDGLLVKVGPATYEGFSGHSLKKKDAEYIFYDLCNQIDKEFDRATLYLSVFNKLTDELLSQETYTFRKKDGRTGFAYSME